MHDITHSTTTGRRRSAFSFVTGMAATVAAGIVFSTAVAGAGPTQATVAEPSSFVAMTPCRLLDTRPGTDNVGPRSTPLTAGETLVQQVTGSNGNCTIPAAATAVALNATAVRGTETSYLTFFPADVTRPLSSNLNFGPGQAPTPNKVDVDLSATGAVAIFNAFGTVDVVVDAMGYYVPEAQAPQPFATSAHSDGQTLGATAETVTWLEVEAPSDGAVVASSSALFGTLAGARVDCWIGRTTTLDPDHRQVWRATSGGPGSMSGSRTFQVQAGEVIQIRLVCQLVSGTAGLDEADLSALFVPGFVTQTYAAQVA